MKRPFSFIVLLMLLLTGSGFAATLKIEPANPSVDKGATVTVAVEVESVTNLGAFEFEMQYDSGLLNIGSSADVLLGPFLGGTGRNASAAGITIDNGAGTLKFGAFSFGANPGPDGDGVLATITFTALDIDGTSDITLDKVQVTDINGNVQSVTLVPGQMQVGQPQTSALVTVEPSLQSIPADGSGSIDITIERVSNLGAFEFELLFDKDLLTVAAQTDVVLGPFLSSTGRTASPTGPTIDNNTGMITFGGFTFGANAGPDGDGILATITFTASSHEGASDISLANLQVTDIDGNVQGVSTSGGRIQVSSGPTDNTPPTTTIALSGSAGENGWYTSDVLVTLSATDDVSGVEKTEYHTDSGSWQIYTTPFTVDSSATVFYRSEDQSGNLEAEKSEPIRIDKTLPSTPIVIDDGETTPATGQLHAQWIVAEAESEVVAYQYAIGTTPEATDVVDWTPNGTNEQVIATDLTLVEGQTYYFAVRAQNSAGLWSDIGVSDGIRIAGEDDGRNVSVEFQITRTAPLNFPANWSVNLIFTPLSITGDITIYSSEGDVVHQFSVSATSGRITGPPSSTTLTAGEYRLVEVYTGTATSTNPIFGDGNEEITVDIPPVTTERNFTVPTTGICTFQVNTTIADLVPFIDGPFTIEGAVPGVVGDAITLKITTTQAIEQGQEIQLTAGFRTRLSADTRITHGATQLRVFVEKNTFEEVIAKIQVVNAEDLYAAQFDLRFSPELLEVVSIEEGDFLRNDEADTFWRLPQIQTVTGNLTGFLITRVTPGEVNGSGTLATVKFRGKKGGESPLTLRNVRLSNAAADAIPAEIESASVIVPSRVSGRIAVTTWLQDAHVVAQVELLDAINVTSFSVDLAFPSGLQPIAVESGFVSGRTIVGINTTARFTFQIYESGEQELVLQNGVLNGLFGSTGVPTLENGAITVTASPEWDVNRDYAVDIFDLTLLANRLSQQISGETRPNPDVNRDGIVDVLDVVRVAAHFGETYPFDPSLAPGPPVATETVDLTAYQAFLQQMVSEIDRHPLRETAAFEQARALLRQLIGEVIPEKTRLLQNYPNPFNPETWIPFQLSQPASVGIEIYNLNGQLIRHLELGYREAGWHLSKGRAAYWDGRNNAGEKVSSGVYFYRLRLEHFAALRKLVVAK